MLKVCKFGGSSLASANEIRYVKKRLQEDDARKIVVVSAMGKNNDYSTKITDLLYLLCAHLKYNVDCHELLKKIEDRYQKIRDELKIDFDIEKEFTKTFSDLKNRGEAYIVSRGEYLLAKLLANYFQFTFVDSQDILKFNYDKSFDYEKSKRLIDELNVNEKIIFPGFYGSYPNGDICLFSRGGSDLTGSYLASLVECDLYENFTDVPGIYMADPKIIKNMQVINEVTYDELRELSYMGANVLHEETINPVKSLEIPIKILSTFSNQKGTTIRKNSSDNKQIITGITGKLGFSSLTILKKQNANRIKLLQKVLKVFEIYNVNVEHIPTSVDSFSLIVESNKLKPVLYDIICELKKDSEINDLIIQDNMALIAIVGRNMITKPGISGKIFGLLGKNNINIRMISQGSTEISIIIGIDESNFLNATKLIYDYFNKA